MLRARRLGKEKESSDEKGDRSTVRWPERFRRRLSFVVDEVHQHWMNEWVVDFVLEWWAMEISDEIWLLVVERSSLAIVLTLTRMNRYLNAVDRFVPDSLVS